MGQVLLVRHGQASFGAADYDVLSENGWAQGRVLGEWLGESGVAPTTLTCGDLRRQRETLEAIADVAGWPLDGVLVDPDWNEFDHVAMVSSFPDLPTGDLGRREFQRAFEQATAAWTAGEHGGDIETYAAFLTRVRGALDRATEAAGAGRTVLVVTSGGVIAAACASLVAPDADQAVTARLWSSFNTVIANASFTRVIVGATGARLLTFNEHPHLVGDLRTYR